MSSTKVILKKSSVVARIPTVDDIEYGELALNYADGKLYYKKSDNTIDSFNAGIGGAGGAADAFKTVVVGNGQSNIVADSAIDTLTINSGGLIAITTDATTDTLTITTPTGIPFFKTDGTQQTLNPNVSTGTLSTAIQSMFIPFTRTNGTDVTTLILT